MISVSRIADAANCASCGYPLKLIVFSGYVIRDSQLIRGNISAPCGCVLGAVSVTHEVDPSVSPFLVDRTSMFVESARREMVDDQQRASSARW